MIKDKASKLLDRAKAILTKKELPPQEAHEQQDAPHPPIKTEEKIKKSQKIIAIGVAVLVVLIIVGSLKEQLLNLDTPKSKLEKAIKTQEIRKKIETAEDNIKPEEVWRYQMGAEGQKIKKDLGDIQRTLTDLIKKSEIQDNTEISKLKSKFSELEYIIKNNQGRAAEKTKENTGIEVINLNLVSREEKQVDTVDTVIPAGAFAKAVLLSGADAGTSLSASSDPLPLLIRITDPGTLPRKFKSDLKDCHIIAEGYGDISSERVIGRLVSLTCTERVTGEIVETEVSGFITGEDGKVGLRGKVIAKEAGYLANSVLGGIIGGFSNTMSPRENVPFILSDKATPPSTTQKFQKGFGEGMSSSMDRLSKYYIDRAESLQPVIEISAGRIIDVIFNKKSEIGSSYVKKEIAKKRDAKRRAMARDAVSQDNFGKNNRYFDND